LSFTHSQQKLVPYTCLEKAGWPEGCRQNQR
jgi:hypothetical protein